MVKDGLPSSQPDIFQGQIVQAVLVPPYDAYPLKKVPSGISLSNAFEPRYRDGLLPKVCIPSDTPLGTPL